MNNMIDILSENDTEFNINKLACNLTEELLNKLMTEQARSYCKDLHTTLNGTRERSLNTSFGTLTLKIPKLRIGSYFPEEVIKRWSRTDTVLASVVCEAWSKGLSTRKVEDIAETLGITKISKSQISRVCKNLDAETEEIRSSRLDYCAWPYVWLDATFFHCREANAPRSVAFVVAVAANTEGNRRVIGFDCIDTESYLGWRDFLLSLKERGLNGVKLTISDEHAGLVRAIKEVFIGSAHQRCTAHLLHNVSDRVSKKKISRAAVASLKECFKQKEPALVGAGYDKACELLEQHDEKGAKLLRDAKDFALAYLAFPQQHAIWLKTNNICERLNKELKRRSKAVGVFPSRKTVVRLIGAVCCDVNDSWIENSHFMKKDSVQELYINREFGEIREERIEEFKNLIEAIFEEKRKVS